MTTSPQQKRWVSLGLIFGGHTPSYVAEPTELPLPPSAARIDAAEYEYEHEYEELMRDAGYEPEVPYPGARSMPWPSKCIDCGASRRPSIQDVERGVQCKHIRRGSSA